MLLTKAHKKRNKFMKDRAKQSFGQRTVAEALLGLSGSAASCVFTRQPTHEHRDNCAGNSGVIFCGMSNKPKDIPKASPCECGCGATTKGGRFLPGHDAKLKKALVDAALTGSKRATAKLEKLGWTKFLDAKREKQQTAGKKGSVKPEERKKRRRNAANGGEGSAAKDADAALSARKKRRAAGEPEPSRSPGRRRSAAEVAAEAAPNLNPPLSENTARLLGFGDE